MNDRPPTSETTPEHYRTERGSRVEISGKHHGISVIDFDWFEEGACVEARPTCDTSDKSDAWLYWQCGCCGSGQSKLEALNV